MKLDTVKKVEDFKRYMFAGNARFSMFNNLSGHRVNFIIKQVWGLPSTWQVIIPSEDGTCEIPWEIVNGKTDVLVSIACDALDDDYGVYEDVMYPKEKIAMQWLLQLLSGKQKWRYDVEILRDRRCGYCGRPLKTKSAIALGLGSTCAKIPTFISVKGKREHIRL